MAKLAMLAVGCWHSLQWDGEVLLRPTAGSRYGVRVPSGEVRIGFYSWGPVKPFQGHVKQIHDDDDVDDDDDGGDDDDVFLDDLVPRPIQKPLWTRHTGWCPSSLAKLDTYFH